VGEGRKEGNGNHLTASDKYITPRVDFGKEFRMERRNDVVKQVIERSLRLIDNKWSLDGPVLGISSKCGFSPILSSAIDICGSVRSSAEQVFTGPET
jgi:hypothetical protein